MATTKEFKDFVLDQLSILDGITCRPMMGGYLLYYKDVLFGGFYGGDRFLVKMTSSNKKYKLQEVIPYDGSKKVMYYIDDIDNQDLLRDIVLDTYNDLIGDKK